jgi:hypothetical protein
MSITGSPEGEPMKVGVAVADLLTGLYATVAMLAALNERHSSGLGQHIDLALLDVQIAALANQGMNFLATGKVPVRNGNAHPNIVPYQAFATSDGHVVIAVGNDAQFARFAAALGLPGLSADPRFKGNADRVRNRVTLIAIRSSTCCVPSRSNAFLPDRSTRCMRCLATLRSKREDLSSRRILVRCPRPLRSSAILSDCNIDYRTNFRSCSARAASVY